MGAQVNENKKVYAAEITANQVESVASVAVLVAALGSSGAAEKRGG